MYEMKKSEAIEKMLAERKTTPELLEQARRDIAAEPRIVFFQESHRKNGSYVEWALMANLLDLAKVLVGSPAFDVKNPDHVARLFVDLAFDEHLDSIRLLVEAGADINQGIMPDGYRGRVFEIWFSNDPRVDLCENWPNMAAVHVAAVSGKVEVLRELLKIEGIDVNGREASPSPLMAAALVGQHECFKLLLEAPGVDLHYRDYQGRDVLDCAVIGTEYTESPSECLRILLERQEFAGEVDIKPCPVIRGRAFAESDASYGILANHIV